MATISKKVILTGSFGVGKTSLFNQFIYSRFSDKYLTTIGVKVSKKTLVLDGRELSMLVWDIAGEVSQEKVPVSYFSGTNGILYVFDLTRPSTWQHMAADLAYLRDALPEVCLRVAGNKRDLLSDAEIDQVVGALGVPCDLTTSARTGENVEALFEMLGRDMLGVG